MKADFMTTSRQSSPGPGCCGRAATTVPVRAHRYFAGNKVGARGFTLIELMIVVAVIGVLLALAYPSYQDAIRKSRRGEAKANLVEAGHVMERFHTENNTYVGADVTGFSTPHYDIDDDGGTTAGTFMLVATPPVGSDQAQDRCGVLTLDHAGVRTHATGDDQQCQFGTVAP